MALVISTGFLSGNLFTGFDADIDEAASVDRYAERLQDAIKGSYPDAVVTVKWQDASGAIPSSLQTRIRRDGATNEDDAELAEIAEHVERIGGQVFEDGAWYVQLAQA